MNLGPLTLIENVFKRTGESGIAVSGVYSDVQDVEIIVATLNVLKSRKICNRQVLEFLYTFELYFCYYFQF